MIKACDQYTQEEVIAGVFNAESIKNGNVVIHEFRADKDDSCDHCAWYSILWENADNGATFVMRVRIEDTTHPDHAPRKFSVFGMTKNYATLAEARSAF